MLYYNGHSCARFSSALGQVSHPLLEQTKGCSKRASRESTCQQGELICRNVKQIRIFLILFPVQNRGCPCSSLQYSPQGDIHEYMHSWPNSSQQSKDLKFCHRPSCQVIVQLLLQLMHSQGHDTV